MSLFFLHFSKAVIECLVLHALYNLLQYIDDFYEASSMYVSVHAHAHSMWYSYHCQLLSN